MEKNYICVVGLGVKNSKLGCHPDFSAVASKIIAEADILAGGREQLSYFANHSAEQVVMTKNLNGFFSTLEEHYKQNKKVVVLADGDPLCFGIGTRIKEYFGLEMVKFFPNISSIQALMAFLGLNLPDLTFVSLHGRNSWNEFDIALNTNKTIVLFTDRFSTPKVVANYMLERGADCFICHVCEELEETAQGFIPKKYFKASVIETAQNNDFLHVESITGYACKRILVFEPTPRQELRPTLIPGQPSYMFASYKTAVMSGFMTRNVACSILRPEPQHLVWDLGAGSGGMSIEIAAHVPRGRVISVEKKTEQLANLYENRKKFTATNLEIIEGTFPECLVLPTFLNQPDRIFIGGGFGPNNCKNKENAFVLFRKIWDCLKDNGRLVATCVLLETLILLQECFNEINVIPDVFNINTSQALALAGGMRFVADNPVFIVASTKISTQQDDPLSHRAY
ncbi:bifunctional cobalt-precorrin-7 (C(5))-methyltransferase/cobalt-precorrin-6B (C(15))-methyltransferase [Desulfovibrio litoralis]|uniref:Precorrin-6Y C5,15-methyltransferase (Decarboxylating) n=1 Tax=Desulfovibrio litoralis DSM 11393 TaxID=1121455 RepID=A0A1M7T6J4_9BACT|nr:bifunctional cobalt-precorrin-7 (C(5))-methyltransferase/cobalt-precorrin-6B (C(15))-methyltransferase [Desulfovibrio litoralis]SHN66318.1 precorrin-6Y C5,15-methyltransferase (decarboxylating) [Desulfovibrio litoralis DSM 11393]